MSTNKNSRSEKRLNGLRKNSLIVSVLLLAIGIVFLVIGCFICYYQSTNREPLSEAPYYISITLTFGVGMTLTVAGIIDLFCGGSQRTYFEEYIKTQLEDTVKDTSFLARLKPDELDKIFSEVCSILTGKQAGSLFNHHKSELIKDMGGAFRETVRSTLNIAVDTSGRMVETEKLSYTCKKGKNNAFQKEIPYELEREVSPNDPATFDTSKISEYKEFVKCEVKIILDEEGNKIDLTKQFVVMENSKKAIRPINIQQVLSKHPELADSDELKIEIEAQSVLNENTFQTWDNPCATKDVEVNIIVPEEYRVVCCVLGSNQAKAKYFDDNHCQVKTKHAESWMLPQSGFVFRVIKNE